MDIKLLIKESKLVSAVEKYAKDYMSSERFDSSHDYSHVDRVLRHSLHILSVEAQENPTTSYDVIVVVLAALLHDVADRKYTDGDSQKVKRVLLELGASEELAETIQIITKNVSYSNEVVDPAYVRKVISQYPELAIVQDADRLDAIGAVGIGRVFTYGGAKTTRNMDSSVQHFVEKLEKLEGMMKTAEGKRLAKIRTERLKMFRGWWNEENTP
jgi:uncharacterized protein